LALGARLPVRAAVRPAWPSAPRATLLAEASRPATL